MVALAAVLPQPARGGKRCRLAVGDYGRRIQRQPTADPQRDRLAREGRRARVERSVFLGSFTRVAVRIDGEPLTLELSGRRDDLVPGAEVTVRIPASALLKLDRET